MIRSVADFYADMRNDFVGATGVNLNDGGDMAIRLHVLAAQLHSLEVQNDWLKNQVFPQTASGDFLDYHADLRGISRINSAPASGVISLSISQPASYNIPIPAGIVCFSKGNVEFVTSSTGLIPIGDSSCDLHAAAKVHGSAGNVPADSIVFLAQAPAGIVSCSNPLPFSGGIDREDDESLRARILSSYRNLPNGANSAFYLSSALAVDGVSAAAVIPRPRGRGSLDVIIAAHNGLPSQDLIDEVLDTLNSMREICVDINVIPPTPVYVDFILKVSPAPGVSFNQACDDVETALFAFFQGKLLGNDIYRYNVINAVAELNSVSNLIISSPGADIPVSDSQLPILRSINFLQ